MNKTVPVKTETRPVSRKTVPTSTRKGDLRGKSGWNLPSGESLAEFALRFGFLAPTLMGSRNGRMAGPAGFREIR
jgi:hypothetical protein